MEVGVGIGVGFSGPLRLSAPPRRRGRGPPVVFVPISAPRVPMARARSPPGSSGPEGRGPTVPGKRLARPYLSLGLPVGRSPGQWSLGLTPSSPARTPAFSFVPGEGGAEWGGVGAQEDPRTGRTGRLPQKRDQVTYLLRLRGNLCALTAHAGSQGPTPRPQRSRGRQAGRTRSRGDRHSQLARRGDMYRARSGLTH